MEKHILTKLLLNNVGAGQVNARNAILANLQNPQPKYLNKLAVEAKVSKRGSDKVIYSGAQDKMQMAPNSNFDYPIQLNGEKLEAGEYTLKLHGVSKEDKWDLEKDFTITKEEAKEYNEKDVSVKKEQTSRNIWVGIIVVIILQLVIVFLIRKNRKKQPKKKRGTSKKGTKNKPKPNKSKPVNNRNKSISNKNKGNRRK